jgi:hypothetical protein
MISLKEQFPDEYEKCVNVINAHPKIRAAELSKLENSNAFNYLSDFQSNLQKAKALISNFRTWPTCPVCNKRVTFFNDFSKTCSKSCSSILTASSRSKKQEDKNADKIASILKDLAKLGITPKATPSLVTQKVEWTHLDHTFNRSLYAGTWLAGCPICNRKKQILDASKTRWAKWKNNNTEKWTHTELTKAKIRKTVQEKYGCDNVSQNADVKKKINLTYRANYIEKVVPKLLREIKACYNVVPVGQHDYSDSGKKHEWVHIDCGRHFFHYLNYGGPTQCPNCRPKSIPEESLFEFVAQHAKVERGRRDILSPSKKEIDIWLPDYSLGIELNGVYWHSTEKEYTPLLEKTKLAEKNNIQLLHIWDYEWVTKRPIIENIILSKLGKTKKLFARKCKIEIVDAAVAKNFYEENHIHGKSNRHTHNIALKMGNDIVFMTSFGKPRFSKDAEWEIIRSCSKIGNTVLGGFSKCLSYFRTKYAGRIITYADKRFFDGHSYEKLGFTMIAVRQPNYYYVKGANVLSRMECQKHKLVKILGNAFDPALTEEQNMLINGWNQIKDCGVSTWVLS